jgi:iron complex outermembrane receptor protein
MNNRSTWALFAAGTALSVWWCAPACAQDNSASDQGGSASANAGNTAVNQDKNSVAASSSQTPAASQADTGTVQEITVTAQRRAQNMQDVPVAVDVASAQMLGNLGLTSTADLGAVAPAVTFSVGLGGAAPTIRGVGGTGAGTDESANALYIDGVYMPSPQSMVFQFNNIERVEVLKGPQGTLFGRNASGGLIQVITKTPRHEPQAKFQLGYSNYDTFDAAGTVSGGLTDSLAVSVSGVYENQGKGWGHNFTTGKDAYKGRFYGGHAKLVWDIDPATTVTAAALYAYSRPAGTQGAQILPGETLLGGGGALGFYDQTMNTPGITSNSDQNYSLHFSHNFDWATFTSISSRDISKSRLVIDADLGPVNRLIVDLKGPKKSWTQEFQLASPGGSRLQWIVGLFYYHGDRFQAPSLTRGSTVAPLEYKGTDAKQTTNSYAAYGQATLPVTDSTNITAGLRYTIDKRQHDVTSFTSNPATPPTVYPTERAEDKKLTWRFAVDQRLGDRILAYASYSRGFKSGLFNIGNPGNPPVRPQTIDAYEVGLKSELFDRRVRLNLSAFHYNIKDIQLRTIVAPKPTPIFYNAARARVNGADAELDVYITQQFSIRANASYLAGKYTSFPEAIYYSVNSPPGFGLTQLPLADATGNDTVYTPHWVTNLSAQYKVPTAAGTFTLAGTWNYNSGYFFDPQNRTANPAYHRINGTVTWEPKEGLWARVYVDNLLNKKYYSTVQASNFGDYYFPASPRTYGVTVGVEF